MTNIIQNYVGWRGKTEWVRRHESGLFALMVCVHGERDSHEREMYLPPRHWNTYLLGGDKQRCYRGGKAEMWIDQCPVTDLVFSNGGESLVSDLPWNCGQTFFERLTEFGGPFTGSRRWKVGDDYSHLYDTERWDYYDFEQIAKNANMVADAFVEKLKSFGIIAEERRQ